MLNGSMLGVSTGEIKTMRTEFDRDATLHVSDVCLSYYTTSDDNKLSTPPSTPVNASDDVDTERPPAARLFLTLALPYALSLFPCTTHGMMLRARARPANSYHGFN